MISSFFSAVLTRIVPPGLRRGGRRRDSGPDMAAPARTPARTMDDAAFAAALKCHHDGDHAEAERRLQELIRLYPAHKQNYNHLALVMRAQGRFDESAALFRRAAVDKDYPEAMFNLAVLFQNCRMTEESIDAFRETLGVKADYAEAHNGLGLALVKTGRRAEAADCFRRAVTAKPDYAEAHNNLGLTLLSLLSEDASAVDGLGGTAPGGAPPFDHPDVFLFHLRPFLADDLAGHLSELGETQINTRVTFLLACPFWFLVPPSLRRYLLRVFHHALRAKPNPADDVFRFGHRASEEFSAHLAADPNLPTWEKLDAYETCRTALAAASSEMMGTRFDSHVVAPFAAWLDKAMPLPVPPPRPPRPLTIAYLAHGPILESGDAAGAPGVPVAIAHARIVGPDSRVLLYCGHPPPRTVLDDIGKVPRLTLRLLDLHRPPSDQALDALYRQVRDDEVDVVITDLNSGVATYLFKRRCAPLQLWMETGQPFWLRDGVDAVLSRRDYQSFFGYDQDRHRDLPRRPADPRTDTVGHDDRDAATMARDIAAEIERSWTNDAGSADGAGREARVRPAEIAKPDGPGAPDDLDSEDGRLRLLDIVARRIRVPPSSEAAAGASDRLERLAAAADGFREATLVNPDFAEAFNNLALTFNLLGRLDAAVENFRRAILVKPDFVEALNNLGLALMRLGRLEEAADSFHRAVTIKPDFFEALNNLTLARMLPDWPPFADGLADMAEPDGRSLDQPDLFLFHLWALLAGNVPRQTAGLTETQVNTRITFLLACPFWSGLPPSLRRCVLRAFYHALQAKPKSADDVFRFGHRASEEFAAHLAADPTLPTWEKVDAYEACRNTLAAVSSEMMGARFDSHVVAPFAAWLDKAMPSPVPPPRPPRPLTIAYLAHCPTFVRGNAIGALSVPVAVAHARIAGPDTRVLLYCGYPPPQNVLDYIGKVPRLTMRVLDLHRPASDQALDALYRRLRDDGVDVVVTDLNSGVATYLFKRRCAPLQLWMEMGQPFWLRDATDVVLSWRDHQSFVGYDRDRHRHVHYRLDVEALCRRPADLEIDAVRRKLPPGKMVIGIVSRLVKVTLDYLKTVRQILVENDNAFLLIAGTGPIPEWGDWLAGNLEASRYLVVDQTVDTDVYGRVFDICLDTFPLHGGNAACELMFHGKPVVTLNSVHFDSDFRRIRDADLLVDTPSDYIRVVGRLLSDVDFLREKQRAARAISRADGDTDAMARDFMAEIDRSWTRVAGME